MAHIPPLVAAVVAAPGGSWAQATLAVRNLCTGVAVGELTEAQVFAVLQAAASPPQAGMNALDNNIVAGGEWDAWTAVQHNLLPFYMKFVPPLMRANIVQHHGGAVVEWVEKRVF